MKIFYSNKDMKYFLMENIYGHLCLFLLGCKVWYLFNKYLLNNYSMFSIDYKILKK